MCLDTFNIVSPLTKTENLCDKSPSDSLAKLSNKKSAMINPKTLSPKILNVHNFYFFQYD